jgi:hypothetical protein
MIRPEMDGGSRVFYRALRTDFGGLGSKRVEKAYPPSFFTSLRAIRWIIASFTNASLLAVVPS